MLGGGGPITYANYYIVVIYANHTPHANRSIASSTQQVAALPRTLQIMLPGTKSNPVSHVRLPSLFHQQSYPRHLLATRLRLYLPQDQYFHRTLVALA